MIVSLKKGKELDMFNPPTPAQLGEVALASSKGDINWYPGSELGDHLEWNGSIWIKRNGWITPDLDASGAEDCSAALSALLPTLKPGACLYFPPGQYRMDSQLTFSGVTITGPESGLRLGHQVFPGVPQVGARFNIRHTSGYGFNLGEEACLRNVQLWYPDQVGADPVDRTDGIPVEYDYAIRAIGQGCTVENISLGNAYRGIRWDANAGKIDTIHGCPFFWGIYLGRVADPLHISNVHFNPGVNYAEGVVASTWRHKNAVFISADGVEQFYVTNCFSFGFLQMLHFEDFDGDNVGTSGSWCGGGSECVDGVVVTSGLGGACFNLANVEIVPWASGNNFPDGSPGIAGNGIKFGDSAVPPTYINRPIIMASNLTIFSGNKHGRSIWMEPNSYGVCIVNPGIVSGNPTAEAVRIEGPNSIVHLDHVGMGSAVPRSANPGGGTLVDVNPIFL